MREANRSKFHAWVLCSHIDSHDLGQQLFRAPKVLEENYRTPPQILNRGVFRVSVTDDCVIANDYDGSIYISCSARSTVAV